MTHDCPNVADLRPGVDDMCDLPESFRRLAYICDLSPNLDGRHVHACLREGPERDSYFCPTCTWRQVVADFRGGQTEPISEHVPDYVWRLLDAYLERRPIDFLGAPVPASVQARLRLVFGRRDG